MLRQKEKETTRAARRRLCSGYRCLSFWAARSDCDCCTGERRVGPGSPENLLACHGKSSSSNRSLVVCYLTQRRRMAVWSQRQLHIEETSDQSSEIGYIALFTLQLTSYPHFHVESRSIRRHTVHFWLTDRTTLDPAQPRPPALR